MKPDPKKGATGALEEITDNRPRIISLTKDFGAETGALRITEDMPCREAAAFLGVNAGTLQKWRNGDIETGLHYARADRIAIKNLGKHPADVWGQDWWKV